MNSAYDVMKGKPWKAINFDWDFSVGDNGLRRGTAIIRERKSFIKMLQNLKFEIYKPKNVKLTRNLSKSQFLKELKEFKKDCEKSCGCLLVTVSSHGVILPQNGQTGNVATYEDYVLTHPEPNKNAFSQDFEDERVSVREIVEIFKDSDLNVLKGIPKIFFIQACRDDSKQIAGNPGVDVGVQVVVVEDESLSGTSVEFLPTPLGNQTKNPGSDEGVQLFVGQDGSVSESTVTDPNVCWSEDMDRESEENDQTFEIPLLYREVQKYVFRIFCSLTDFFTLMFLVENKDTKDDLQKILSSMGYKFPEVSEEVNIGLGSKVSADRTTIKGEIEGAINSVKNTHNIKVIRAKAILTDEDLLDKKCKEMSSEYHRGNISAHLFEGNILLVGRSGEALNELGRRLKEQQYICQEQIEDLTQTASNSSGISAKIPQIPPESQIVYSPPCIDDSVIVFSTPFGYAAGFNTVRGSHVWSDLAKKFDEFTEAQRPVNLLDLLRETNWQLSQTEKTIDGKGKVIVYKPLLSICHKLTRHIVFDRKADKKKV